MLRFFKNLKKYFYSDSKEYLRVRGFTFVELLVTVTIVSALSAIIFSSQSSYLEGAALQNLADDIGLEIAVAQSYSTSVRELTPGSGDFETNYGVSFSIRSDPNGSPTSYIVFADYNGNGRYNGDFSDCLEECLRKVDISRGNMIEDLCLITRDNTENCGSVRRIDVLFIRPNLQPTVTFFNEGGGVINSSMNLRTAGRIKLVSPSGLRRYVTVYFSGQVAVE